MQKQFEIYLQTSSDLYKNFKSSEKRCKDILDDIIHNQDKINFDMWGFGLYNPNFEISYLSKLKYDNNVNIKLNRYIDDDYPLLKISLEVDLSHYKCEEMKKEFKDILEDQDSFGITFEEFNYTVACSIIEKRIQDLVVAANISKPGSLRIVKGAIVYDKNYVLGLGRLESVFFKDVITYCAKIGYPTIIDLDFTQVWSWIVEFKTYITGFSDNKIERALNCFALLLENRSPAERLFYSIMGIEALYATGSGSLQEQVRSKSEVFLGKQDEFKKVYTRMYDFRSRFIHGDLNFPSKYNYSIDKRLSNFVKNLDESNYFAIGLLIASLQKLCLENKYDLNFKIEVAE